MASRGWEGVTQQDLNRLALKQAQTTKPAKYHNVKVVVDGHRFDSQREAAYWCQLRLREKAGEIQHLRRQVRLPLYAPDLTDPENRGAYLQIAEYLADFEYWEGPQRHVVDTKGVRTALYRLKAKWLALQENLIIEEV